MRRKRRYAHQLVLHFAVRALKASGVRHGAKTPRRDAACCWSQSRTKEAALDWQPPASMTRQVLRELLRYAFDGVGTVFRILVADLPGLLEAIRIAPRLDFLQTVERNHHNARF